MSAKYAMLCAANTQSHGNSTRTGCDRVEGQPREDLGLFYIQPFSAFEERIEEDTAKQDLLIHTHGVAFITPNVHTYIPLC